MEKKTYTSFQSKFLLFCISLATLLQACTAKKDVFVSVDVIHQKFYGPLYPNPSPNEGEPGVNVEYRYEFAGWLPPGIHMGANRKGLNQVYASSEKGAAAIINPLQNTAVEPVTDFKQNIFFNTGVSLALKRSSDASLGYLQAPFYALYRYKLSDEGNVFGGFGPYAALGFAGSAFSAEDGFKRFDAGLGFTAGYTMTNSFTFGVEYELGLANIQKGNFGGKAQNRGFNFHVGYPLDKLIGKVKGK